MHQPLVWLRANKEENLVSNLQKMLLSKDSREAWDGKLIARAYKNPAKYVKQLKKEGYDPKIMLDFSGVLLESLVELGKNKVFDEIEVEGERIGDIIKLFREVLNEFSSSIEVAGTAYSHCYFPATPEEDWIYQIEEWQATYKKIFGREALERVKGFWLPELGIPGFEDKLVKLIRVLNDAGYEWLILPLQAVEGYEHLSYEERIQVACQPHMLKIKDQAIPVIFRFPSYIIDQQAGCEAKEVYDKAKHVGKIFKSKKPALLVPACDGENGNVMMNEFFPKTFVPFFKERVNNSIGSLTVSEFLDKFYKKNGKFDIKSEIKVKIFGASWVDTHKFWLEGTRRMEMVKKIEELSKRFHSIKERLKGKSLLEEVKRALLIAETSCYVYWGTDFWFDQGEKAIEFANRKMDEV